MQDLAMLRGARKITAVALALTLGVASCAARNGPVISANGNRYEIIGCPGALQNDVRCDEGFYEVGRFDDGLVCAASRRPKDLGPEGSGEACSLLSRGCVCTKGDEVCAQPKDIAMRWAGYGEIEFDDAGSIALPTPVRRCAARDRDCGPVPSTHVCLERTGYVAQAPRIRDDRLIGDECGYDGECIVHTQGCETGCVSFMRAGEGFSDVCISMPEAPKVPLRFCGCVKGRCAWFHQ
jgi:hypothetical protein